MAVWHVNKVAIFWVYVACCTWPRFLDLDSGSDSSSDDEISSSDGVELTKKIFNKFIQVDIYSVSRWWNLFASRAEFKAVASCCAHLLEDTIVGHVIDTTQWRGGVMPLVTNFPTMFLAFQTYAGFLFKFSQLDLQ